MPNYCENTLIVEGDLDQLVEFKKNTLVNESGLLKFTMNKLVPTPEELLEQSSPNTYTGKEFDGYDGNPDDAEARERWNSEVLMEKDKYEKHIQSLIEKYGYTEWYCYRTSEWGTKWDICETYSVDEMDGEGLSVHYSTAWSPNIAWIEKVSKMYPNLKFLLYYEEPGMSFAGRYSVVNGIELCNEQGDLEYVDEDGNIVSYDSSIQRYRVVDTNEIIENEDFMPYTRNPFIN